MNVISSTVIMAPKARSNGRQDQPTGRLHTVDDTIRERVKQALKDKGWEQKDLAAKLDVVPATITNLLKLGEPRQIRYLPKLYRVLGLENQLQTVIDGWSDLPQEDRDVIERLVASRRRNR